MNGVRGRGREVRADPLAEATLDNVDMAPRATHRDGRVYLRLNNGTILRGVLRGATPTHIILVGTRVPVTEKGPACEHP